MFTEAWRKVAERIRSQADRITHTSDRRRARRRVVDRGPPQRILVLCYGNICRSPYAAAYLRRRLLEHGLGTVEVDSAGFFGPGRPANNQGSAIASARGFDLSAHRSKLYQRAEGGHGSLVLVMTHSQRAQVIGQFGLSPDSVELLGDFDPADPPARDISDPYGHSNEEFERVFDQIERSVDVLCGVWAPQGGSQSAAGAPFPG